MFFDTHAHYDDERFDADRAGLLESLPEKGVVNVINAGSDLKSSEAGRRLAMKYGYVYYAAGIHPHCAAEAPADFEKRLEVFFRFGGPKTSVGGVGSESYGGGGPKTGDDEIDTQTNENCFAVAAGEIGLDYHYDFSARNIQREIFARQLAFAGRAGVPVIIHDREAHADIVDIIKAHISALHGGVFHCFTGDRALARQALALGFHVAFGGAVTFKNASGIADAAAYVPDDMLLIETDCPYMTPAPFRGKRNDSTYLGLIAERLAQIRGAGADDVARVTTANAKKLFLPKTWKPN